MKLFGETLAGSRIDGKGHGVRRVLLTLFTLLLAVSNGACTRPPNGSPSEDPFEAVNRPIFMFNSGVDTVLFRPVAKGYEFILPEPARDKTANFYDNITYPVDIVNAFLQGKFKQGFSDTGRFALNSTLGLAGFLDPATLVGLTENEEDFGQTFSVWGIPQGPYIVIPLLGPSTVASGIGIWPNTQVNPIMQWPTSSTRSKLFIAWTVDSRARLLPFDEAVRESFDPYLFIRDAYLQNRQYLIFDGNPPVGDFDDEFDAAFDEAFEEDFEDEFEETPEDAVEDTPPRNY